MKLYLVRHGESIGNMKQGFISGQSDIDGLTDTGRVQIIRAAWSLKKEAITGIVASPVARAQETARIIGSYLHLKPQTHSFLSELHHGIFEGFYWWEVIHKIPLSWRAKREDFRTPYPGGESMETLLTRVSEGLFALLKSLDENGTYVVVSHQAVITTIRYCLEHGPYTTFADKKAEASYLKFLHKVKLENGCYAVAELSLDTLTNIHEVTSIEHVKPDKNSVSFYAKTLLNLKDTPDAERMESASGNAVYRLSTPKHHILKVIRDKDQKSLGRQVKLYRYLASKFIPAPVILHVDQSRTFFADDVLIQDYVEGDVIKNCFTDHPEKTEKLLQTVFEKLQAIHNLPHSEVTEFWQPPTEKQFLEWKNFMILNINMTLHMIQEGTLEGKALEHIQESLSYLKDYVREKHGKITPIHGDVGTDNIIVAHDSGCNLIRIIDFEWARIGDPLWDFAYFWGFIERDNPDVAVMWRTILEKNLPDQMIQLEWYRILFHAWSVRDMVEYKESTLRQRRGKKSVGILTDSNLATLH
ncbi:histidine phosphatase family protein [Candidatus Woesebacteria bacterium]|nr:histidine phosphatase family protein [Candidatus Woesebacteria bacterium]